MNRKSFFVCSLFVALSILLLGAEARADFTRVENHSATNCLMRNTITGYSLNYYDYGMSCTSSSSAGSCPLVCPLDFIPALDYEGAIYYYDPQVDTGYVAVSVLDGRNDAQIRCKAVANYGEDADNNGLFEYSSTSYASSGIAFVGDMNLIIDLEGSFSSPDVMYMHLFCYLPGPNAAGGGVSYIAGYFHKFLFNPWP